MNRHNRTWAHPPRRRDPEALSAMDMIAATIVIAAVVLVVVHLAGKTIGQAAFDATNHRQIEGTR